jgi:hypothetical protein
MQPKTLARRLIATLVLTGALLGISASVATAANAGVSWGSNNPVRDVAQ